MYFQIALLRRDFQLVRKYVEDFKEYMFYVQS